MKQLVLLYQVYFINYHELSTVTVRIGNLGDQNFENGNFLNQTYFHIRYH